MVDFRPSASLLRLILSWLALLGVLTLTACGGGNGAPNNPYTAKPVAPPVLTVEPVSITVYAGQPATVTITSGAAPFFAYSDNPGVLPVTQTVAGASVPLLANSVQASTQVTITIQDSAGQQVKVPATVLPSTLVNSFSFTTSTNNCGTNLCTGETGYATVTVTTPVGGALVGRQMRFDVIFGPVAFESTNPAQPLVQTITRVSDNAGVAAVAVQAQAGATTQPAQLRVTDVTTGQQQIVNFVVVKSALNPGGPDQIVIVPADAAITTAFNNVCSTGFRIDYYVYGGTPPYVVASSFPAGVTLVNTTVAQSGGFFEAVTNGACVAPLTFTVADAAGKQATATLHNTPGSNPPTPAPALVLTPNSVTDANGCSGKTYQFVITGGTAPYNVNVVTNPATATTVSPQIVSSNGGTVSVTFSGAAPATVGSVVVLDTSVPQQTVTGTITCTTPAPPAPSAMTVTPASASLTCPLVVPGTTAQFVVKGGTPPYVVSFASAPNVGATLNGIAYPVAGPNPLPSVTLAHSGDTFTVANLIKPPAADILIVSDSASAVVSVTITCL